MQINQFNFMMSFLYLLNTGKFVGIPIDYQIKMELLATIGVNNILILPTREQFEKLINIESLNLPYVLKM